MDEVYFGTEAYLIYVNSFIHIKWYTCVDVASATNLACVVASQCQAYMNLR